MPASGIQPLRFGPVTPLLCLEKIADQASSNCLTASSVPTTGSLYPLGPAFNIDVAGNILIGNGSIYKAGAPFIHTLGGINNTALGTAALESVTTGYRNTASGFRALASNTTGHSNTASGARALHNNTTGFSNTASGYGALRANTTGNNNTASGYRALASNTVGFNNTAVGFEALDDNTGGDFNCAFGERSLSSNTTGISNSALGYVAARYNTTGMQNTAIGGGALYYNTTGSLNTAIGSLALVNATGTRNIALGFGAGSMLTNGNTNIAVGNIGAYSESGTIRIGNSSDHSRTFIAAIRGKTTGVADAVSVLIDSAGQLGTMSSSRRFKEDIEDMGETTEKLLDLRPVMFRYKQHVESHGDAASVEYGLIAEEVAEVFPDLVVYDDEGDPFTVKYHLLSSMLLNELQRQHESCEAHDTEKDAEMEALRVSNAEHSRRLEHLEALAGESLGK